MKGLVVGGGSIGKRHSQNLKILGVDAVGVVETVAGRREALTAELPLVSFEDLQQGLAWSPDFVILATPTHLHVQQALQVASQGIPLFVEKPLSHSQADLEKLSQLIHRQKLLSMVGCNMRFHPGPAKVKALLQQDRVGRILFARVHTGSYLPDWRPTDYRDNYAAREETGGGCLLDCIHEIDLARWYLGEVREVFCMGGHLSSLEIETEDVAALVCRHNGGAISEIHLDYVQRSYERGCQIVGELGTIFWEFSSQQVRCFDSLTKTWTSFSQPPGWDLNQMYLDEMKLFLESVCSGKPAMLPISEAVSLMQVVFSAKASMHSGQLVATRKEVLA